MRPLALLEAGLCGLILLAPLPFGSVAPGGRLALEILALVLTATWGAIAWRREVALPPRAAIAAVLGLLGLALIQIVPLPQGAVETISPRTAALRDGLAPLPEATLSLAPLATASAVRTGAALAGILFVTTSVVAARGAARLALAAVVAAAFQGLYGTLVLASGHARIWNVPKTAYLDSATGTFVNHNHYAAFLAATLPLGLGLSIAVARRARGRPERKRALLEALGPEGSLAALVGLLALTGVAGLLLSYSRAGTALGLAALAGTAVVALRARPVHRVAAIALAVAVAAIPLVDLGADRLAARYAASAGDLGAAGGRLDVARDTLAMIAALPAAGCGFGAFTWAFPAFASPGITLHYTHAHNDALQAGAEGGLPALVLVAVLLASVARAGIRVLASAREPVATGAVFGLAALLLHAVVDFNFHIPANAAIAAALAGLLFGATWSAPR
ncbi:MAG TPA: O-antigen ligase family protein [Candidatus Polarisedimenticolaceae bacterium]|nr:O-antigen ligase family protein [Candidatus Polarisedimenticolaceae bacterium]